ncbi:MAG TPA: M56 family metallopeptidase [Candidatus Sulfotelmatobacter sp.]|nr:M56 family metallopeptidase [Candidatus Sulfotelmatobacter sp.]
MMFAARCIGISLAVFVLVYMPLSLAVGRGWRLFWQICKPASARGSANFLFALRIFPLAAASVLTFVFTLPSFLLLEPRAADEAVGAAPTALGLCCLALLAVGMARTISAHRRTSRALAKWLDGSTVLQSGAPAAVFRTGLDTPTLTVAGIRDPKVLVSEAAVAALTPAELRTALRHEMAHVRSYDNLKKILFRFSVFPGMTSLEHAWSEESELAADDAAVSSLLDALELASALIKVSRLRSVNTSAAVTTGLLHSATALGERVQRLFAWEGNSASRAHVRSWYALPPVLGMLVLVVTTYGSALSGLHTVTEWLVR